MNKRRNQLSLKTATAIAAIAMLGLARTAIADDPLREVEAAFIYNFTQFIEWPRDTFKSGTEPFVVGVLGDQTIYRIMQQTMEGKKVGSHAIKVKFFPSADDVDATQVLFIPADHQDDVAEVMEKLGHSAVLTVGENAEFLPANGGIRLYTEERRMRFEVNLSATDQARLKISSKLLKLAKIYGR